MKELKQLYAYLPIKWRCHEKFPNVQFKSSMRTSSCPKYQPHRNMQVSVLTESPEDYIQHYLDDLLDEVSHNHDRSSKDSTGNCLDGHSGAGAIRGRGSSHAARGGIVGRDGSRVGLLHARGRSRNRA